MVGYSKVFASNLRNFCAFMVKCTCLCWNGCTDGVVRW